MSSIVEVAFKFLFRIVAELVLSFVANIALSLTFRFFLRTGDFLIDLVTLNYFRDYSSVPMHEKPLHPVPDWASALLGLCFWCAFAVAAFLSWPWLSSW
ncbi:MAG TPA: hypothetical protein VF619_00465 [Allosphingosinicella sp.]|jgi:hypothetical protein